MTCIFILNIVFNPFYYFLLTVFTRITPAALIKFLRLKCGAYSRAALIWGRRLFKNWNVPIDLSRLLKNFLEANAENRLLAEVTGKREREAGLVVPAKFTAFTTELCIARIVDRELNGRAVKYNHYELKNNAFDEKRISNAVLELLCSGFLVIRNSSNKRRVGTAALIRWRPLLTFCLKCGAYLREPLIRGRHLFQ